VGKRDGYDLISEKGGIGVLNDIKTVDIADEIIQYMMQFR
jgi:hypothetical protein